MKKILLLSLGILALTACGNRQKTGEAEAMSQLAEYTCEYFSLQYPQNWKYEEETSDTVEPLYAMGTGFRVTFTPDNAALPYEGVVVQKSAMTKLVEEFKTPEQWRDLSLMMKAFNDENFIGPDEPFMRDSLTFQGYPAAMAGFGYVIDGDTIVQKQWVVMVDSTLYYINNIFSIKNNAIAHLNDSVISTLTFHPRN